MRYVTGLVILIAAGMACSRGNDRAVVQSPTGPTAVAETTIAYIGGVSGPMDVLFPGRNESFHVSQRSRNEVRERPRPRRCRHRRGSRR